ncbi:3-oxoacyl-ACP reductase FabG [Paenibacillus arenosi]|uniref:3-oxoacyl-ACP reductase FabG n=1 Tax=Paenibacillus arenosi TaxID=2774142 RepID=A0ABR9AV97_9BACL|nr:3-oxoacyl-ACP reductase FabG [Paenibacillus arenosi]MBD8497801.1 3-oxoacyl-ACP reductase FabG [Paenibacillus arenosi]
MGKMTNKIAVVTGGARGIGREICRVFLREGASKVYSIDRNIGEDQHERLEHVVLNVLERDDIERFVRELTVSNLAIDVLVNNAGITRDGLIHHISSEMWDQVIDVNLKGVFQMTQAVAPIMMNQGHGSIINISSIVGLHGNIGQTNYAATKSGVIGMTYTWAKEFTRKGAYVRTNAIAPGFVHTEMLDSVPDKVLQPILEHTPLGRLGKPEDIANAALFLASEDSSFVNGHVLSVDGGLRL